MTRENLIRRGISDGSKWFQHVFTATIPRSAVNNRKADKLKYRGGKYRPEHEFGA